MKRIAGIPTILALASMVALAGTRGVANKEIESPQLIVAKFHSDTCASCKVLDQHLPGIRASVADKPVLFVEFDFTNPETARSARMLARQLGLHQALGSNRGTGILLISDANRNVSAKLTKMLSAEEMKAAIHEHLVSAT
jgi:hypothetical protein